MSTWTTFHDVKTIRAIAGATDGAPLMLLATDGSGHRFEVSLFTDSFALTERLTKAINDAVAAHEAEKAEPELAAAE